MPDWYPTIRAARYLGIDPTALIERGDADIWVNWALTAEAAENEALASAGDMGQDVPTSR